MIKKPEKSGFFMANFSGIDHFVDISTEVKTFNFDRYFAFSVFSLLEFYN